MILWIDGCFGVGKSTVADAIAEMLPKEETQVLSADIIFREELAKDRTIFLFGYSLQNNEFFMKLFKERIESFDSSYEVVIVDMSLSEATVNEDPIQYFISQGHDIIHIILYAAQDEVERRIKNDAKRDKQFALNWVSSQSSLLEHYKNDIHIETTNKSAVEIATEIVSLVLKGEI